MEDLTYQQTAAAEAYLARFDGLGPEAQWRLRTDIARNQNDERAGLDPVEVFGLVVYGDAATPARLNRFVELERAIEVGGQVLVFTHVNSRSSVDFVRGSGLNYGFGYSRAGGERIEYLSLVKDAWDLRRGKAHPNDESYGGYSLYTSHVEYDEGYDIEGGMGQVRLNWGYISIDDDFKVQPDVRFRPWEGQGELLPVISNTDALRAFMEKNQQASELNKWIIAELRTIAAGVVYDDNMYSWDSRKIKYSELLGRTATDEPIIGTVYDHDAEDPIGALGEILFPAQ